nr:MAG TPA: hypothetical protein [Caudoviricetes sp.]
MISFIFWIKSIFIVLRPRRACTFCGVVPSSLATSLIVKPERLIYFFNSSPLIIVNQFKTN